MARNTKKKLAIFAGTSKCLIYAEAKYCASEMPGEIKYYECSRTEYCCGIGCCVSPGLHFHHLWYYWILVIVMFLVCSGGGWWYRYWLQGRYRAAASAIPTRTANSRAQNPLRPTCQGQRARISYNSARNTVLLHRMWKGPQRNGALPGYTDAATTSAHYQNMSVVLNDANCPYYQLYGPPPSYETVIAQTRGKISNPASPETSGARMTVQSPSVIPNTSVPQCFSYACNPSTRLNNGLDQNTQYQNGNASPRQLENPEAMPFAHFPQYCVADGALRQNVCVPFNYQDQSFVPSDGFNRMYQGSSANYVPYPMDKSSDTSDPETQTYETGNLERYMMLNMDCTAGSSRDQCGWEPNDRGISKMHGNAEKSLSERVDNSRERENLSQTSVAGFFSVLEGISENDSKSTMNSSEDLESEPSRNRRVYGGSLKATGRYANCEEYSVQRAFSKTLPHSCDGLINTDPVAGGSSVSRNVSPLERTVNASASSFQSNPSNNVILESFVSDAASSSTEGRCLRLINASTNSDLESKHRLDRSKSLD